MLYKRSRKTNAHWWVRFEVKGVEVRQSSGTDSKERAQAFEQELRNAIWDEQNLGIEIHSWADAVERWCREKASKRSLERDKQAIVKLKLSGDVAELRSNPDPDGNRSLGAREIAVYRSILNACAKWGWLDKAPKVEMPHAEKHEPRWITEKQQEALLKELPPHAAQMARFGAATGLRSGNIRKLRWSSVDLKQRILFVGARDAKSRKSGGFPLNDDAIAILKRQSGAHKDFVFTDHLGRAPVGSIKTTWAKAVKRAGLEGFRFHDLRHTWAARHTLAGTPPI